MCLPVPIGCGKLGATCCPPQLRPSGSGGGSLTAGYPTPFCFASGEYRAAGERGMCSYCEPLCPRAGDCMMGIEGGRLAPPPPPPQKSLPFPDVLCTAPSSSVKDSSE